MVINLDVTSLADATAAAQAAIGRFGRIDVLVNNAGNFVACHFEELFPEDMEKQLVATLTGPMNRDAGRPAPGAEATRGTRHDDLLSAGISSSDPPTPRPSSASKAGWDPSSPKWRHSASTRPS